MDTTINNTRSRRRYSTRSVRTLAAGVAVGLAATALGVSGPASASTAEELLAARMQPIVDVGYPGVLATRTDTSGSTVGVALGKGDVETGQAPPLDGEVRIGSNTKTMVAVIVMQLVEEGKVALDEPVDTYLPGLLKGEGIDGSKITVRQLLQHTSGLPEYTDTVMGETTDIFEVRNDYYSPRDLLDVALAKPAQFEPGAKFAYSSTNYIALGLLVEKVTKRTLVEQIDQRIAKPLGLAHTYLPVPGDRSIHGDHPKGYHRNAPGEQWRDITDMDPSWAWAVGAAISTPGELNMFMQKTLDGTLVSAESLAEMKKTVPMDSDSSYNHGLGLISTSLSCGTGWQYGGTIPGYRTRNMVGPDGSALTIVVTAPPHTFADISSEDGSAQAQKAEQLIDDALEASLCGT